MSTSSSGISGVIADRYAVEREVGRGGMAVVYLANDLKHGRRVAIKVMAPEVAELIGPAHFLREVEIAARLNHPHILPLFDSGMAGDRLYCVMPFIEGESLRARLRREMRLPLAEALRLTREIAGALGHAHLQGLVHRDVKPENVLLSDGIPLVADFGVAYTHPGHASSRTATLEDASTEALVSGPSGEEDPGRTQRLTAFGPRSGDAGIGTGPEVVGTPLYMAPEQARGSTDLDGRADLYALGCLFYELLAGEPPFRGRTIYELLERHMSATPPDITAVRPEVPEDVARALARALAKDPANRFPGMAQFSEALNAAAVRVYALAYRERGAGIPNNLPVPATSFIGREKEMAGIKELLRKNRLLTLSGSGGAGKTRLALQVAAEVLEEHPDGVWLVELAPLSDPALVAKATAAAIGLRETPGEGIAQTLVSAIGDKRALLVLDNCEHVIDAAAQLAGLLLRSCPALRLIASSREALGIGGEVSFKVPSLPLPDAQGPQTPDAIAASSAVRLFLERAAAVKPDFGLTAHNAIAVASVCRRLDGLPLAIELAAARVRTLPMEQIEARLDSRFRLLTGGSRTALPRQQTLRALIDWSYDLLQEPEKELFCRLSIFSGGWTLASAEKVCQSEGLDSWEVLDLLTSLVDKSLALYEEAEATSRYRFLETVRQYAHDRLLERGNAAEWRDRHLEHFLALAEAAAPQMTGADQQTWLARLEAEHGNLRAALEWSEDDPARSALGLRLSGALQTFWMTHGHFFEGRERMARALARDSGGDLPARARALNGAANLAFAQADYVAARALHEESLAIRRTLGDQTGIATSLNNLCAVSFCQGDMTSARALLEESLRIRRRLGERRDIASSLNNLALIAQKQNDLASAQTHLAESLALRREVGDRSGVAASLHNLGVMAMLQGDHESARALWEEALSIRNELGDRSGSATTLHTLGALALAQGNRALARARFLESLRIAQVLGNQLGIASALEGLAPVAAQTSAPIQAVRLWAAAARIRADIGAPAPPEEQETRNRDIEDSRRTVGEEAFAAAWAHGQALTMDEAADAANHEVVAEPSV